MAKKFKQLTLKPGRYHVGNGKFIELDAPKLRSYVDGTKAMLKAGLQVPMIFEHPEPGAAEGSPRDKRAEAVKHGAGWLSDVAQGDDGAMTLVIEPTDADTAKKIADGSIRFTSPELRKSYTDGKGRTFENVISHVALTHRPRNPDQGKLEPLVDELAVAQFSLDDYVPAQFSDDDEHDNSDATPPVDGEESGQDDGNPDLPGPQSSNDKQWEACVALLAEEGIILPAEVSVDEFVPLLLTALKTKRAASQKADEEDAKDEEKNKDVVEETPQMQFSLSDVRDGRATNKLLGRVIEGTHAKHNDQLDELVRKRHASAALKDRLMNGADAVQFSLDGDEQPSFTRGQVIAMLADCPPPEPISKDEQFSMESHPEGDDFYAKDAKAVSQKLDAILDKLAEKAPNLIKKSA